MLHGVVGAASPPRFAPVSLTRIPALRDVPTSMQATPLLQEGIYAIIGSTGRCSRFLPIVLYDILQRVIEGILTEQLAEIVTTLFPDIVHDLRDNQPYTLVLQGRENRAQCLRRGVVHVIDRGGIEAEPA